MYVDQEFDYYYGEQIKNYIDQFAQVFSEMYVTVGKNDYNSETNYVRIPIVYGSPDKVVSAIKSENTQNKPLRLPMFSIKLEGINIMLDRKSGTNTEHRKTVMPVGGDIKKDLKVIGVYLCDFLKIFGSPYFKINDGVNFMEVRSLAGYKISKEEFDTQFVEMYKKECEKFEILKAIKEQGSMMKALNSYIEKLAETDECRMHYRLFGTASGRLSSGNGSKNSKKKNHYFIDLNAQNLTKPKPAFYEAIKDDASNSILGWSFNEVSDKYAQEHMKDKYIVEGFKQETNIRSAIKTPPLKEVENKLPLDMLTSPKNVSEEEVFEIELENNKKIKGTKSSIYHVIDEGIDTYLTLEEIMRRDDIELLED